MFESSHFNCIAVPCSGFPDGFFGASLDINGLLKRRALSKRGWQKIQNPAWSATPTMLSTGYHTQLMSIQVENVSSRQK